MSPQPLHRFGFITLSGVAFAVALPSCDGGDLAPGTGGATSQAGFTSSTTGGSFSQSGGASGVSGSSSSSVSGSTSSAGASSFGGSGSSVGGTGSNNGSAGTGNSTPCTNKQHPDHMDKPCSTWPEWDDTKGEGEPRDCDAPWLTGAGYCLESCGKCSSGSGSGGSSNGSGGSSNGSGGSSNGSGGSSNGSGGSSNGSGGTGLGPGPNLPNLTSGEIFWASRYWDCCKTHCATNAGAQSCGRDGVSRDNGNSACAGGSGYACYSEAPRAIGDNVSYGHVAVPNPSCNSCYHIQFTGKGQHNPEDAGSQRIAGKHMIVRVSNTGGDVAGHQFDLMIPGGGMGINQNTCTAQWGLTKEQLGDVQGGFMSYNHNPQLCYSGTLDDRKRCVRAKCDLLPAGAVRNGCYWWVDWLNLADNPQFRYEKINCPSDI